jgi:broad-specificity NMP kinase
MKPYPYIINITGIQGSGKSYICHKLKHIPCIDTDKVVYNTFTKLLKNNKKFKKYLTLPDKNVAENIPDKASNILFKQAKKDLIEQIKRINKPLVIVVGITIDIKSHLKFFIKLNDKELERTYKRVMMREIDKIKNNYNNINPFYICNVQI